ncbi:MAG: hypothetical protein LH468_05465, partial [Nocardioides sp.]|nr:hypothetical protein [Nocardioides sp.]
MANDQRVRVQAALDTFLDGQAERLAPLGSDAARLVTEARTSVSGGKMLRASFCYWGHRAVAPPPPPAPPRDTPPEGPVGRAGAAPGGGPPPPPGP